MTKKVNLKDKFKLFKEYWTPKVLGEFNDSYVKIFKAKDDFVWHRHDLEDEFFLVVSGELHIALRNEEIILNEGEFYIVPKGVEHKPYASKEAHVLLIEPKQVINTGDTHSEKTVMDLEWL